MIIDRNRIVWKWVIKSSGFEIQTTEMTKNIARFANAPKVIATLSALPADSECEETDIYYEESDSECEMTDRYEESVSDLEESVSAMHKQTDKTKSISRYCSKISTQIYVKKPLELSQSLKHSTIFKDPLVNHFCHSLSARSRTFTDSTSTCGMDSFDSSYCSFSQICRKKSRALTRVGLVI